MKAKLDNIAVVLRSPRFPENIGAAARAMRNMGLSQLIVVEPELPDMERMCKMATHEARELIESMRVCATLDEALSDFNYIVGTTARLGGIRQTLRTPRTMAEELVPLSQENRIALLFGPEDRGLTNEDLRFCHMLVNIPTFEFKSLNLAQAVMVLCYEIFNAALDKTPAATPKIANRHELDAMYAGLKDTLIAIDFINHENPDYFMFNIRQAFNRLKLKSREVQIIRGLIRQVNWYGKKRYEDGLADAKTANLQQKD